MAGYEVICVDIKHGDDILTWDYKKIPKKRVAGILAAPPCTDFTVSCNRLWEEKDKNGKTAYAVSLVKKCIEIKNYFKPIFFALENPVGRLSTLVPELGDPWYWQPYWYGEPWKKKSGLWGYFNKPMMDPVPVIRFAAQGSWSQLLGGKSDRVKEIRSITPAGFSRAFFDANNPLNLELRHERLNLFGQCKYGQWTCHFCTAPDVCENCDDADCYEADEYAMQFDTEEDMMRDIFDKANGIVRHVNPQRVYE